MKIMTARYSMPDSIPDYIKDLPEGAQKIFVEVFNSTLDEGASEEDARMAGWGAVKNVYEKSGEEWTRKAGEMTLRYVSLLGEVPPGDGDSGVKTSIVQVFRTGTFRHPLYGKFTITDDTLRTMATNFKASRPKPPTEMVVDYEHMSAVGPPSVSPAAGWVKSLEAHEGKLLATVEWTDKATGLIHSKEYRFISPEWNMNYKDKESGKDIGPCLLSMALTNRPFIEGMQPVILSDRLEEANAAVLVLSENMLEQFMPKGGINMKMADWDTEYINDLPDKAFAYIAPGGEKDEKGKTVPRDNRHLPYRNMDGSTNLDHLRNALARLDQTSLSQEAKAEARRALEKAAEEAGVGEAGDASENKSNKGQEDIKLEEQLRELLGLTPEADILEAVKALKAKADAAGQAEQEKTDAEQAQAAAETKLQAAEARLAAGEVDADVDQALKDGHILPKQVGWAKGMRAKDPEGFKTFLASAPKIGPEGTIIGLESDEDAIQLTETEVKVGKRMGVSKEELVAQKKRDALAKETA